MDLGNNHDDPNPHFALMLPEVFNLKQIVNLIFGILRFKKYIMSELTSTFIYLANFVLETYLAKFWKSWRDFTKLQLKIMGFVFACFYFRFRELLHELILFHLHIRIRCDKIAEIYRTELNQSRIVRLIL